jgi:hypothetical protein
MGWIKYAIATFYGKDVNCIMIFDDESAISTYINAAQIG